ncbi:MAG: ribosomal protein S18-alanine N-acetyltransferase [Neisseriaceae bacterium]|nr:ribosomal protein S18-alanine N-acetyltransferase [Neisseriaceae bacterium]
MIVLRQAKDTDLSQIVALNTNSNDNAWAEQHFQAALNNNQIEVIEYQEKIIAFAIWQTVLDEAELHLILTDMAHRRQGYAEKLIQSFVAKNPHIRRIILEVRKSNTAAINLYKKQGFKAISERKDYYMFPIENALIMEKIC